MASSGSTDDDFRSRVEKVFGSLAFSRSSSSSSSPSLQPPPSSSALWSLTDEVVEKREWRRDQSSSHARDQTPCSSSFDDLLKQRQRQRNSRNTGRQLEDDHEDLGDEDDQLGGRDDDDGDEWSIRSSIGLDPTLDDEEEEDEYDKVASGRENAGERLYMKDITDQGFSLDSRCGPFKSSRMATRDPRANHFAAKIRLKEDEVEAQNASFSHDNSLEKQASSNTEPFKDIVQPKPILKRKDNSSETKPSKRVRFDLGSRNEGEEAFEKFEEISTSSADSPASERDSPSGQTDSQIPDILLNPSKYTRYSFDSSIDVDDKSNSQAYVDFLKLVKGSKLEGEDASGGLPKKITFIPKKKTEGYKEYGTKSETKENGSEIKESGEEKKPHQGVPSLGIAGGEASEGEFNTIEEDEAELDLPDTTAGFRKPGRHYRPKTRLDETDA